MGRWIKGETELPPGDVLFVLGVHSKHLWDQTPPELETADLQRLAQLTDLHRLGVSNMPAGGLRELLPLKNLTFLTLASSKLTEADFALLPSFRKLSEIRVGIPNKSALETVATLPHLSRFTFEAGSTVADDDLKILESIRTLSTLDLVFINVSREAAQAFTNARPDVHVNWKDGIRLEPVSKQVGQNAIQPPPLAIAPFNAREARQHQETWAKHLGVPVEYTNSIGMKFRLIPPGEFLMGSTPEEIETALKDVVPNDKHWQECIKSEAPQHNVILTQPIYLGVNEVTQTEYEKVMGVNPSHFAPMGAGKEAVAGMETTSHPVEMVSWNDAAEFCAKLSQQEKLKPFYFRAGETITPLDGTGYRLPSEAEWEFVCRAGTATKFWIGDKDEDLARAGWFGGNASGHTHAAGKLDANPFGLFDIHGNVWEWVQDGWDASYYGQSLEKPAINPNNPFSAGSERVFRGGAWDYATSRCRSSGRGAYDTTLRSFLIGFRVSLTVDAVRQSLKVAGPPNRPKATASKFPPLAPGWFERVSKLPPEEQVNEVTAELKRRNPEWDGEIKNVSIKGGHVRGLTFDGSHIVDLSPISVLKRLTHLVCHAENKRGKLTDLTPLAELHELGRIDVPFHPELSDLSPLAKLPIIYAELQGIAVTDLSPLKGKNLTYLHLSGCRKLTDISPVQQAEFSSVNGQFCIHQTGIRDISPLKDSPLQVIVLIGSQYNADVVTSWKSLRSISFAEGIPRNVARSDLLCLKEISTLTTINGQPAADFWKAYDKEFPP